MKFVIYWDIMTDPSIRRQGASKDKAMFVCIACKLPRTTQQAFTLSVSWTVTPRLF